MTKDRDISPENLIIHGITYESDVYPVHDVSGQSTTQSLPDHVIAVGEALLSFENIIPQGWENHLRKEDANFDHANSEPD
jgi:hypothetical protein